MRQGMEWNGLTSLYIPDTKEVREEGVSEAGNGMEWTNLLRYSYYYRRKGGWRE